MYTSIVEIVLAVATIIGGIGAVIYLIEKARRRQAASPTAIPASPSLPELVDVILSSDPYADWEHHAHGAATTTVFKTDVNLRFEMAFEGEGVQARPFIERWATGFPDKTASGYYCDLYYGSTLLKRFVLVNVDGGRATLPLPRSAEDLIVEPLDYRVAEIHDRALSLSTYMARARMRVLNGA